MRTGASGIGLGAVERDKGNSLGLQVPNEFVVVDAASGDTLAKVDGRFAGWSPDGTWFYVARETGLPLPRVYQIAAAAAVARLPPMRRPPDVDGDEKLIR